MAGESQYINPIIQSMFETARLSQQVAQRKQQGEQFQQELKLRQQAEDARDKQIQAIVENLGSEAEHRRAQLELETKKHLLAVEQAHNESIKNVADYIRQGGNPAAYQEPPTSVPSTPLTPSMTVPGTPSNMVNVPGVGLRPVSAFQSQQEAIAALGAKQKAVTTAEEEAKDPFIRSYKGMDAINRLALEDREHKDRMELARQQGGDRERIARIEAGAAYARTKLSGEDHIKGLEIANGIDPEDPYGSNNLTENLMDGVLQGQVDINKLAKGRRNQLEQVAAVRGWTLPTDAKAYKQSLDNVNTIEGILNQARDLANGYSRDTTGGTNISKVTGGLFGGVVPGTNLNSKLDTFKTQAGQLVTTFDNLKRTSDANILRSVTGAFDPKATKAQNLEKVEKLTNQLNEQTVKNSFRGFAPDEINHVLASHGVTNFGGYGQPTTTTPKGTGKIIWGTDAQGLPIPQGQQ